MTDPFGHADINNNTTVEVVDNQNVVVDGPYTATVIPTPSGNTKEFQYVVNLPSNVPNGVYSLRVRANEGTEGTVWHTNATQITVTGPPLLMVTKLSSHTTASPGDEITYTVVISNNHILSTGDAYAVVAVDKLPAYTSFKIGSIVYTDGYTPFVNSGLATGTLQYSNDGGTTWAYTPVSGGGGAPAGFDSNVTHFRMPFNGIMPPNSGFRINYSIRLN